jgi:hypothetical protein
MAHVSCHGVAAGGLALCSFNLLARFQANFSLLLVRRYGRVFKGCFDGLLTRVHYARQCRVP